MKLTVSKPNFSPANALRPRGVDEPSLYRVTVSVNVCPGWTGDRLTLAVFDDTGEVQATLLARKYVTDLRDACIAALGGAE